MTTDAATIDRLLASDEPAIRWKTRVQVLGENAEGRRLRSLQREIRESPRVRKLLSGQDAEGRITRPSKEPYSKWYGAHWVLASLADTGYPRGDRALRAVRDQVVDRWLRPHYYQDVVAETRAQAYRKRGVPFIQGRPRRCASQQSNALWSVLTLGLADERADALAERLLHWQWPDGGWNCDKNPDASVSSFHESVLPLRALALYARETGDREARAAAKRAAEPFLERRLFRRRRDGRVMAKAFVELHYPRYWHYDVLGGLAALAEAGFVRDRRCEEALDLLESKRLPRGGWPAEKRFFTFSRKTSSQRELYDWGPASPRRMNQWVTVEALAVLRAAGRLSV